MQAMILLVAVFCLHGGTWALTVMHHSEYFVSMQYHKHSVPWKFENAATSPIHCSVICSFYDSCLGFSWNELLKLCALAGENLYLTLDTSWNAFKRVVLIDKALTSETPLNFKLSSATEATTIWNDATEPQLNETGK